MIPKPLVWGCLLISFFIVSCASAPSVKKEVPLPETVFKEADSSRQIKGMNERILANTLASDEKASRDYRIGSDDLLEIIVFEEEKLNRTVRVSSQGHISLPLVGVLRVKGLTANELEGEIRDLLSEKYLQNPQVGVFIREYRNQRISVTGAVEKPGVFDVTGEKTVLDLLSMAGGLKEDAGHLLFLIRRPGVEGALEKASRKENPGSPDSNVQVSRSYVIDLEELLLKGALSLNLPLLHGDVINIPVSGKIFVGGEVTKPGGFPLRGKKVTVSQAISMAEGLNEKANGSETKLFRYSAKTGEREILSLNVTAILKGQSEDPFLQENDILIVPKSGAKGFLVGLRDTFKGLLGFGITLGGI